MFEEKKRFSFPEEKAAPRRTERNEGKGRKGLASF